jgi:predicted transcriptional regulator
MIHKNQRRRSKLDIIIDILESTQEGVRKSRIAGLANLNYKYVMRYVDCLVRHGMLDEAREGIYVITPKGLALKSSYDEIMGIVRSVIS